MSVLLLTGCGVRKGVTTSTDSRSTDMVTIRETLRDTVVTIQRDSAMISALLECDSLGQVHLLQLLEYRAGDRLKPPQVKVAGNVLTATATVDSMKIYLRLKDRLEKQISSKAEVITRTVEINRLTAWQKFRIRLGEVLMLALLVWLGSKIYKLIKL